MGGKGGVGDGKLEAVENENVRLTAGGKVSAGSEGRVSQESDQWSQESMGVLEGTSYPFPHILHMPSLPS